MLPNYNVNSSLIIGEGFKGCILQGPGILFNNSVNYGAILGTCPPDTGGCKFRHKICYQYISHSVKKSHAVI